MLKIRCYKGFEIHHVTGDQKNQAIWKYDIYHQGLYFNSMNSLKQVKQYINNVIWAKGNIPL